MNRSGRSIAYILLGVFVVVLVTGMLFFRPRIRVSVTHELIGPNDPEVWNLLDSHAPLEEIQKAVKTTGKHVDQIERLGGSLLSNAVSKKRQDLAIWLLDQGANPNGTHPGSTPLERAIGNEDADMVKLLLKHGADPDLEMGGGLTPRWIAINSVKNKQIIEILETWRPRKPETQPQSGK